jgi:hypothetical protein
VLRRRGCSPRDDVHERLAALTRVPKLGLFRHPRPKLGFVVICRTRL